MIVKKCWHIFKWIALDYITNYYDKSSHGKVLEELYMSVIAIVQMIKSPIWKLSRFSGKNTFVIFVFKVVLRRLLKFILAKKNPNYWFEEKNKRGFTCCNSEHKEKVGESGRKIVALKEEPNFLVSFMLKLIK